MEGSTVRRHEVAGRGPVGAAGRAKAVIPAASGSAHGQSHRDFHWTRLVCTEKTSLVAEWSVDCGIQSRNGKREVTASPKPVLAGTVALPSRKSSWRGTRDRREWEGFRRLSQRTKPDKKSVKEPGSDLKRVVLSERRLLGPLIFGTENDKRLLAEPLSHACAWCLGGSGDIPEQS